MVRTRQAAERRYDREKEDLRAGRKPRARHDAAAEIDVATACNKFLAAKKDLVDSGELKPVWSKYCADAHFLVIRQLAKPMLLSFQSVKAECEVA